MSTSPSTAAATGSAADPPRGLPLGGTTYGWLHQKGIEDAFRGLAEAGFRATEITTAAPHLQSTHFGRYERYWMRRVLASLSLTPVSVNPGFLDINLLSQSTDFRELSERVMTAEIELAADLDAPLVVLIPGRRHALAPAPEDACRFAFSSVLDRLVTRAERLGVVVGLETSPYGYLGSGDDLKAIVDEVDSPHLGIVYDCANVLAFDDPAEGVRRVADRLVLAHISDTWHDRWAHTSPGRGDVDFSAFAAALRDIGYRGQTIYELVDGEDPEPRLAHDIAVFTDCGWVTDSLAAGPLDAARTGTGV